MPVDESNQGSPPDAEQRNRQPGAPQGLGAAASGPGNSWLSRRWLIRIGLAMAALLILLISLWTSHPFIPRAGIRASSRTSASLGSVVSLGRIEPEDGVITLSARSLMGQPSLVSELRVKEGDYVQRGQVLAILDSSAQLDGAWREAEGRLGLAQTQLDQVEAGAKTGDLAAQKAEIERTKAELANAENEQHRNQALYEENILSATAYDAGRLRVERDRQLLNEATQRYQSLAEVRPTDVKAASANMLAAKLGAVRAKAEYEASIIRSPVNGRVIKIHSWPGEQVAANGLLELAKTDRMYVIAEVLESDLSRISVGERTTIAGDVLPDPLEGTVEAIGMKIAPSEIIQTDPGAFADTRIVEVKVRILDAKKAESFINGEVQVTFHP